MSRPNQQLAADQGLKSQVKIPFLPGNTFSNPKQDNFSVSHTLDYKNGIPTSKLEYPAVGGSSVGTRSIQNRYQPGELEKSRDFTANWTRKNQEYAAIRGTKDRGVQALTSHQAQDEAQTIPSFIAFDKLVLAFRGFYKEAVHESATEVFRVRELEIYYYMEDDTISINEHKQENSGIPQGTFLKRHRVPRDENHPEYGTITIDDLDIGKDIDIYGRIVHLTDANASTREYLFSQYGRELGPPEETPVDSHHKTRNVIESHIRVTKRNPDTKQQKFLQLDRQVLRFNGMWDDVKMFGEKRFFAVHFFLADDTMEVLELQRPNSGYEAFPTFVRRQRVPRDGSAPVTYTDSSFECYKETDLEIGKEILIFGRNILLYDCDEFTKQFYMQKYGFTSFEPLELPYEVPEIAEKEVPPYIGFGSELDSLGSVFHVQPRPWPRDVFKMLVRDKDQLHYLARWETNSPVEVERRFVITFFLSDDSVQVSEPPQRNLGVVQGKWMERAKLYKPDSNVYYTPQDFFLGAVLEIRGRNFVLLECDNQTYQFQQELGSPGPDYVRLEAEYRLRLSGLYEAQRVQKALDRISPKATPADFRKALSSAELPPSEHELMGVVEAYKMEDEEDQGQGPFIDVEKFRASLKDLKGVQNGEAFRSGENVLVSTITPGQVSGPTTRAFGKKTVTITPSTGHGVRNATLATSSLSLNPTDKNQMRATTRAFGPTQRQTQPSPSYTHTITHTSGVPSGHIKRSLLEGETEQSFRTRLKRERDILQRAIDRILLKHPTMTEAYGAFTMKQTSTLSLERFCQQIVKFGVLTKSSEMDLLCAHFFGEADEITYLDFVRAMNPEETPITFQAAIAPDSS
ncbi:putative flagellar protofilament ribbon protein rib74 [Blattamonas nauphoetae]|uniref:Flagellar protofilament ribbon protein rib74 n=1 Tax=Blattamonas nauphoetae TaxID=2049346 RepID=A0ABQ9Y156_9EUKA|nr:putative flagellar protofilament ribbon protein rib74 [Blattamonas nauphoetae]